MQLDLSKIVVEILFPALIGLFVIGNMFMYLEEKSEQFKKMGIKSRKYFFYTLFFLFRFFLTYSIAYNFDLFPQVEVVYSTIHAEVNLAWIILAFIWLPEIIAVLEWALFFSVFALAGLGAAMFIDYSYFSDRLIFPYIGPLSLVMIIAIILSVRYFSNYSLNEIKRFRRFRFLSFIIDIAEASFACIGGIFLWKVVIDSKFYKNVVSKFLDKIESSVAAFQVLTIILVAFLQFPVVPYWLQLIIIISGPVGFISVIILILKHRWYAWKLVFEVYTEEFSSQSLTIFQTIVERGKEVFKKYRPIVYWALLGNWFTIAIALYDIYSVIITIIPDVAVTLPVLGILALKYVSSMIHATKIILSYSPTE